MATDIVGEEFDKYVLDQIKVRQESQGSGLNNISLRTANDLQYLNNRNAWIKLASSVEIVPEVDLVKDFNTLLDAGGGVINYQEIKDAGKKRLKDLGIENPENFHGVNLAQNAILFNTLSTLPNLGIIMQQFSSDCNSLIIDIKLFTSEFATSL